MRSMHGSMSGLLAGGLLLAGACSDDAPVPPLPLMTMEPEVPVAPEEIEETAEASGYRVVEVDETGTVTGRVRFRGVRPRLAPFDVPRQNDACGYSQPNPVFVVGPAGAFADVVVWVDLEEGAAPTPGEATVIDQVGCRYVPHVSVVHRGERVLFRNSDAVLHNVRAEWEEEERWFNMGQPRQGESAVQVPQRTGVARLVCDAGHPWMLGWVHVFDHPYHAITDSEGAFRIEGVPTGTHRVRMWHASFERLGQASGRPIFGEPLSEEAQVTVIADMESEMTLVLTAPAVEG
jgi:plastocyanin